MSTPWSGHQPNQDVNDTGFGGRTVQAPTTGVNGTDSQGTDTYHQYEDAGAIFTGQGRSFLETGAPGSEPQKPVPDGFGVHQVDGDRAGIAETGRTRPGPTRTSFEQVTDPFTREGDADTGIGHGKVSHQVGQAGKDRHDSSWDHGL